MRDYPTECEAILKALEGENSVNGTIHIQVLRVNELHTIDMSARPDQVEASVIKEITKYAPVLEPFCQGPKAQVALINVAQGYCYDNPQVIKTFSQILKVLYNKDCVSDQAIIYWYQKGAKPQGKQHFLKAAESLVKYLREQQDEEESEEEAEEKS